jgi:hypothetical protein
MKFPQFRKYANGLNYFKLSDKETMEEIQLVGKKYSVHQMKAVILPERNHIMDLLDAGNNHIIIIDEKEYNAFYNDCVSNRVRI